MNDPISIDDKISRLRERIIETTDKISDTKNVITESQTLVDQLREQRFELTNALDEAKSESAALKRFIWISDNPNIVELRNELLMVAKLIKDHEVKK